MYIGQVTNIASKMNELLFYSYEGKINNPLFKSFDIIPYNKNDNQEPGIVIHSQDDLTIIDDDHIHLYEGFIEASEMEVTTFVHSSGRRLYARNFSGDFDLMDGLYDFFSSHSHSQEEEK